MLKQKCSTTRKAYHDIYLKMSFLIPIKCSFQNFCFFIRISSKNNRRQVVGKTSYDGDPHIQNVLVPDSQECYVFKAIFTDDELRSSRKIYKKVMLVLSKLFTVFESSFF